MSEFIEILPKIEPTNHMSTNQRGVVCGTKENPGGLVPQGKDLQKKNSRLMPLLINQIQEQGPRGNIVGVLFVWHGDGVVCTHKHCI
jgi:hypothetical protein